MMMTQEKMLAVVGIEPGSLTLQSLRGSDCAILIPWRRRGSAFSWGGFVCCLSLGFDFGTLPFDFLKKAHFSTSLWQRGFDFWLSLHFLIYQVAHLMKGCASIHCGFCECRSVLVLKSLFELSSLQHYSKKSCQISTVFLCYSALGQLLHLFVNTLVLFGLSYLPVQGIFEHLLGSPTLLSQQKFFGQIKYKANKIQSSLK